MHASSPLTPVGAIRRSSPVDGFRLAYDRRGHGSPVVALHGWPSDRHDWRPVADLLPGADFISPDLRGFGESDAHERAAEPAYTPAAQAASVLGLIDELSLGPVVLAGYDLGSMVADEIVRSRPELVRGLVLAPPLPGLAARLSEPSSLRERWYIAFHQTPLATRLIDGDGDAVRATLTHFWSHWSGADFRLDDAELDRLTAHYATPSAFTASTAVYRSGRPAAHDAPVSAPATLLWPTHDPLFPAEWASDVDGRFADAELELLEGVGHFAPREAPTRFADAIRRHLERT